MTANADKISTFPPPMTAEQTRRAHEVISGPRPEDMTISRLEPEPAQPPAQPLTIGQKVGLMLATWEAEKVAWLAELDSLREQVERHRDEAARQAEADLTAIARLRGAVEEGS